MDKTLPRISFPPIPPATPEEIERRRQVVQKSRELREGIGPIDLTVEELLDDSAEDD